MNDDKELLELAAKAAGIEGMWDNKSKCFVPADGPIIWEPLSHDGDALRLAVKLALVIWDWEQYQKALAEVRHGPASGEYWEDVGNDPYAAARRAIVRAAAAIGEQMK